MTKLQQRSDIHKETQISVPLDCQKKARLSGQLDALNNSVYKQGNETEIGLDTYLTESFQTEFPPLALWSLPHIFSSVISIGT